MQQILQPKSPGLPFFFPSERNPTQASLALPLYTGTTLICSTELLPGARSSLVSSSWNCVYLRRAFVGGGGGAGERGGYLCVSSLRTCSGARSECLPPRLEVVGFACLGCGKIWLRMPEKNKQTIKRQRCKRKAVRSRGGAESAPISWHDKSFSSATQSSERATLIPSLCKLDE